MSKDHFQLQPAIHHRLAAGILNENSPTVNCPLCGARDSVLRNGTQLTGTVLDVLGDRGPDWQWTRLGVHCCRAHPVFPRDVGQGAAGTRRRSRSPSTARSAFLLPDGRCRCPPDSRCPGVGRRMRARSSRPRGWYLCSRRSGCSGRHGLCRIQDDLLTAWLTPQDEDQAHDEQPGADRIEATQANPWQQGIGRRPCAADRLPVPAARD